MNRSLLNPIIKNSKKLGFDKFLSRIWGDNDWMAPDINELPDPIDENSKMDLYSVPEPERVVEVLSNYGVKGKFKDSYIGPAVTTYEIELPMGSRMGPIQRFKDDIARDLGVSTIRVLTSIQGRSGLGIEVPHGVRFNVNFKNMLQNVPDKMELPILLGEDTFGKPQYLDLVQMPHLLIAGQTGSGKSVFINSCLSALLCLKSPDELRLVMVDPKQVEFSAYKNIPHLKDTSIAHEPEEARNLLDLVIDEMEERFALLNKWGAKNIKEYKEKSGSKLPFMILVMDEFAELVTMGSPAERKDVETKVGRLAQKARAVGIHLILATQYPTRECVTSRIKANMPTRISFSVASQVNSRVILDEGGAEDLLGNGDMLISSPLLRGQTLRMQSPYVSDEEINYIVNGK